MPFKLTWRNLDDCLLQIGAKWRQDWKRKFTGVINMSAKTPTSNSRTEQLSLIKHCAGIKMNPTEIYDFLSRENSKVKCSRALVFRWHIEFLGFQRIDHSPYSRLILSFSRAQKWLTRNLYDNLHDLRFDQTLLRMNRSGTVISMNSGYSDTGNAHARMASTLWKYSWMTLLRITSKCSVVYYVFIFNYL